MSLPEVNRIYAGDCIETMKAWPENFVDTIITDPPYGIGFMGKAWDSFDPEHCREKAIEYQGTAVKPSIRKSRIQKIGGSAAAQAGSYDQTLQGHREFQSWCCAWATEALRIAKPGAMMLVSGGTRTFHRMTAGLEDAGWQIRDCLMWLYGSGFPKSLDISKAIDKAKGAERTEVLGTKPGVKAVGPRADRPNSSGSGGHGVGTRQMAVDVPILRPATELSEAWNGWGTALKPAWEPIIVAMKPLDGTFAHNAETWGVAGLNVDGGRISAEGYTNGGENRSVAFGINGLTDKQPRCDGSKGRWPANLILDEEAAGMLDGQHMTSDIGYRVNPSTNKSTWFGAKDGSHIEGERGFNDRGGASRYFFIAKGDRPCGQENTKADDTFVGKNAESRNGNLSTDGFGNDITGRFLPSTISITETETRLIMSFPILNALSDSLIGTFTIDAEKPSKPLNQLSIVSVSAAESGVHWIVTMQDRQELLAGTAKIVAVNISGNGTKQTEPITTPICGPTTQPLRMFYVAKSCRAERNEGCEGMTPQAMDGMNHAGERADRVYHSQNNHPTVKPLSLMKYLCMLTKTPTGGIVLDPFAGSGTTLWAAEFHNRPWIGIEMNPEYVAIAEARIARERSQIKMVI